MSDLLILADPSYSSWSQRAGLLVDRFALPVTRKFLKFIEGDVPGQLASYPPARTVPTLVTVEGAVIGESLGVAEELASRYPDAGLWPSDPKLRATARALASEMHGGFAALREFCPMNLRVAYSGVPVSEAVRADLDRIEYIWGLALDASGGPWLCGDYSIADAFYAPVAARIAGYGLEVGPQTQAYVAAHLADPAFRRWRAIGWGHGPDLPWYKRDYPLVDWPGPEPLEAKAVEAGPSENSACPYSGKDPEFYLECEGKVWGFCNIGCRDKTVADPLAWPAFAALLGR